MLLTNNKLQFYKTSKPSARPQLPREIAWCQFPLKRQKTINFLKFINCVCLALIRLLNTNKKQKLTIFTIFEEPF